MQGLRGQLALGPRALRPEGWWSGVLPLCLTAMSGRQHGPASPVPPSQSASNPASIHLLCPGPPRAPATSPAGTLESAGPCPPLGLL